GSARASRGGSQKQGIGLRIHYFYSSTDAAWTCRITDRSDLVRNHVGEGSTAKCSGFHHGDRLLSPVDSPERERPSLCGRGTSADSGLGFDCHRRRFVCQFGRKSNRSRQHSGLSVLWQHPQSLSGRLLHSSSYWIGCVFRSAPCTNCSVPPVLHA